MISTMLQTILQNLGYQVTIFRNTLEALVLIEHDSIAFGLLITDMTMSHLKGFELAQRALAIR